MTIVAHLASLCAIAAWALVFGRWLRDPSPGAGLAGLVVLAVLIALAMRQLYASPARRAPAAAAPAEPEPEPIEEPALLYPVPEEDPRLDLNAASVAELEALPGVGPVAAARIVAERETGGPFASVEALSRVPGFGAAKIRALADRARV